VQYKNLYNILSRIREANPPLEYIYIMVRTDKPGMWKFVVDIEPTKAKKRRNPAASPGYLYNASRFPEMLRSFSGPSADTKLEVDEWGVTLSGYAPLRDKNGQAVAMVGVDIMADEVYQAQQEIHWRAAFVLVSGIMLSLLLGILFSRRITEPIKKLVEGTRHIAAGNLKYEVQLKGRDEITELARAFNNMAHNLYESRRKLHNYFYRTILSLIRVLEARDHYTRGHSEKVAEYAAKIAKELMMTRDRIELVKEAAILHDIGKLGVQETILNKKEKLTEQEWEAIRRHPLIGEDILRPVLLDKEILDIIRGHHERYDGKGYPDKLKGDDINVFSKILSVADAYDAMTSPRPYRPALTQEEAIRELEENKGTQFDPLIVDTFVNILKE
jgi:putative nucleotidyltransferase with HDIG domain